MVNLGVSPRSLRRVGARGIVLAGLVAGTSAAFAPSAHAATPTLAPCVSGPLQPSAIKNGNSGVDVFTSGSASVTVNGATVTFTPNGTNSNLTVSQTGTFGKVQAVGCETLSNTGGTSNLSDSASGTCTFTNYDYQVNTDGSDVLNVLLTCQKTGTMTLTTSSVIGTGPASGAATPELGSGELLATGLVPAAGLFLLRRRRQRRAAK